MLRNILQTIQHVGGVQHYIRCLSQIPSPSEEPLPLIPDHINIRSLNKRPPVNSKEHLKFSRLQNDIQNITHDKTLTTEDLVKRYHVYLNSSTHSHFTSSQLLKIMAKFFSDKGDISRCEEIFDLFVSLGRTENPQFFSIYNNYLLSLLNSDDTEVVREIVSVLIEQEDVSRLQPLHAHNILRILLKLDMQLECMEILEKQCSRYRDNTVSSEVVLLLTNKLLQVDVSEAQRIFETYQHRIDQGTMIADNYALLGIAVHQLYPPLQEKAIASFLKYPLHHLKSIHHIPTSGSNVNSNLCRTFQILLHVATERQISKTFRIIGGRNGLMKHLIHHTHHEYVTNIQFIVSLCKSYNVTIDETFWRHLIASYFLVEQERRGSLDYKLFLEFYNTIRMYSLTHKLWSKIIIHVYAADLKLVLQDLIKVGIMDDTLYTILVDRNSHILDERYKITTELQALSSHYTYDAAAAKTET